MIDLKKKATYKSKLDLPHVYIVSKYIDGAYSVYYIVCQTLESAERYVERIRKDYSDRITAEYENLTKEKMPTLFSGCSQVQNPCRVYGWEADGKRIIVTIHCHIIVND